MLVKEYIYYDRHNLQIPFHDGIEVVNTPDNTTEYLVSNASEMNAQTYAPEIDFYLLNTQDSILEQAKNTAILFEARSICYDFAQDMDFSQEVGKNILLVGKEYDTASLKEALKAEGFAVLCLLPEQIEHIEGHLGALHVSVLEGEELASVDADQMVWFDAPQIALRQSGVLSPSSKDTQSIIDTLMSKSGTHTYKNFITYDPSICQYHERREEICGKCAEVCPTVAIVKEDETKHLHFSHIDCHGCGGCVSVCPSGSMDYSQMPRAAFYEIAKLYEGKTALIIPRKMELEGLRVTLPSNVLPFAIEGEKYLHEAHLMSLLQESGSSVIFYSDFISKGTGDVIALINQAYQAKYGTPAIYVAMNREDLEAALSQAGMIAQSRHGINEEGLKKREIFAARLAWMVGSENLGTISSGEHVRYGDVKIDASKCTLCLSCVGACNVRALTAHPEDNSLRLNSAICTSCGYCEMTCPEKGCMEVVRGEIALEPSYFTQRVMAQDTLFACIECGKPFATSKSIERIASMMAPLFAGDDAKVKTLYCCAECKPKMMFQHYLDQRMN